MADYSRIMENVQSNFVTAFECQKFHGVFIIPEVLIFLCFYFPRTLIRTLNLNFAKVVCLSSFVIQDYQKHYMCSIYSKDFDLIKVLFLDYCERISTGFKMGLSLICMRKPTIDMLLGLH